MIYRETGQFRTSYAADQALFPILLDRVGMGVILLVAFVVIPLVGSPFFLNTIMIPFLVFALATIGLNLLTGYAGQISLGTGAFMGVGAYASYKLTTLLPGVDILLILLASGGFAAARHFPPPKASSSRTPVASRNCTRGPTRIAPSSFT